MDRATAGNNLVLPLRDSRRGLLGTVAVKVGFKFDDTAESTGLDELGEGDEIGVPPAVWVRLADHIQRTTQSVLWIRTLVNGEELVLLLCDGNEVGGLLVSRGKRFLADNFQPLARKVL